MTTRSVLLKQEPRWLRNRIALTSYPSINAQSWLYESGSLTQRLRATYGDAVRVQVLSQHWQTPLLSERCLLQLPEHRYSLIREVMLHADGTPLILARTVIPIPTFNGIMRRAHLGTRPLGEIIFSYRQLQRQAMDISLLPVSIWTATTQTTAQINQPLWGRRTVYAIEQQQMLVNEFFMPSLCSGQVISDTDIGCFASLSAIRFS